VSYACCVSLLNIARIMPIICLRGKHCPVRSVHLQTHCNLLTSAGIVDRIGRALPWPTASSWPSPERRLREAQAQWETDQAVATPTPAPAPTASPRQAASRPQSKPSYSLDAKGPVHEVSGGCS